MITVKQKKILKKFLSLAAKPEDAFTYDQLRGYLFGIAITPDILLPSEWLPIISGGEGPEYASLDQAEETVGCLMQVYNTFISAFQAGNLEFPYDVFNLKSKDYESIYEWVFGFDSALALRPEIWEPEELPDLSEEMASDVFSSLMVIQGLIDPEATTDIIAEMPAEIAKEVFPGVELEEHDKAVKMHAILLASLPMTIDTLQNYARTMAKKGQQKPSRQAIPLPIRSVKIRRNDPCPCNSGKKFKKCCGQDGKSAGDLATPTRPAKKAKVIQGNFPQHSKKSTAPVPVYQLKISLEGAKPPIWRRIQIPGSATLLELHTIIQHCMGWTDSHLHTFIIDNTLYAPPDEEESWQTTHDESRYTLRDLEKQLHPYFRYTYDFGDNWEHRITIEKILNPEEGSPHAVLLTGKRACPPEDIGGIYSYMELLKSINAPEIADEHEQAMTILGENFQPERFSKEEISEINDILKALD